MSGYTLSLHLPVLALLLVAAVEDVRHRRIPNWLTFSLILTGLAQSWMPTGVVTPAESAMGLGAGFGLTVAFFLVGAMGAGDVKLLAGLGAWVGPWMVVIVFCAEAIIGMGLAVIQAHRQGRFRAVLRNTAVAAISLAHTGESGLDDPPDAADHASFQRLAYAVPVLLATVATLGWSWIQGPGAR